LSKKLKHNIQVGKKAAVTQWVAVLVV